MIIKGQLHRITNRDQFAASYLSTGGKPTVGFKKWGRARLHLATDVPTGKFPEDGSFIPTASLKSNADSNGNFSFHLDDKLGDFRAYVIAYEQVATITPLPGAAPVPVFAPFYRSQTFRLKEINSDLRKIYVYQERSEAGFSQSEVDKEAFNPPARDGAQESQNLSEGRDRGADSIHRSRRINRHPSEIALIHQT